MTEEPALRRSLEIPPGIDVAGTLAQLRRGRNDPSMRFAADGFWRAGRTLSGPATIHLTRRGTVLEVTAWGDGAETALDGLPSLVGLHDDVSGFRPEHPLVARVWRDLGGRRIPRTGQVAEALVSFVLEQRVTTFEARRAQHQLAERWGDPAPGPGGLRLGPDFERLAGVPYYELHVIGIEQARADTVRRIASNARRLDALATLPARDAYDRLLTVPGVGPWTAAHVSTLALGDPDSVPVGDLHLPRDVTYALTGTAIDDDRAMLEALAPFAGHRGRVVLLLIAAGIHAPRHTPRAPRRDLRDQ